MQNRYYQQELIDDTYEAWGQGMRCVMGVAPTGSGKTVVLSNLLGAHVGHAVAIAHRQELVSQIGSALNKQQIPHRIIANPKMVAMIESEYKREDNYSCMNTNAPVTVIGVDTVISRQKELAPWLNQCTLSIIDEGHHVLKDNKWGKALALCPNSNTFLPTATPHRADGMGLGRHADGLVDTLIETVNMRDLINQGYLTDYRVFAPPSDLDMTDVPVTASGDFSKTKVKKAVHESHLVGDVVKHYLKIALNKLGITFASDVEAATEMNNRFNQSGVPSEIITAKTPLNVRSEIIRRYRRRELLMLVNVDLFGEGFDLPAIEVVIFARPTQSFSLYIQQFGRGLRIMQGKDVAIIIDHVGNVVRHGLPDRSKRWSLDRRSAASLTSLDPDDDIPIRICTECTQQYSRILASCPHCGHYPEPASRSELKYVDGDLMELSPETLQAMREEVDEFDTDPMITSNKMKYAGASVAAYKGAFNNIVKMQHSQQCLRESIAWWASTQQTKGLDDHQSYRKFYLLFGIDVMSAKTLKTREALMLANRVNEYIAGVSLS